jgi:hypothetical protein
MYHTHTSSPAGRQQPLCARHTRLKLRQIVAKRGTKAPRLHEVPLEVNHHQRSMPAVCRHS